MEKLQLHRPYLANVNKPIALLFRVTRTPKQHTVTVNGGILYLLYHLTPTNSFCPPSTFCDTIVMQFQDMHWQLQVHECLQQTSNTRCCQPAGANFDFQLFFAHLISLWPHCVSSNSLKWWNLFKACFSPFSPCTYSQQSLPNQVHSCWQGVVGLGGRGPMCTTSPYPHLWGQSWFSAEPFPTDSYCLTFEPKIRFKRLLRVSTSHSSHSSSMQRKGAMDSNLSSHKDLRTSEF